MVVVVGRTGVFVCWWVIFRFVIGGSIWGAKFIWDGAALLRFKGEVRTLLLVDERREAGLETKLVFDDG